MAFTSSEMFSNFKGKFPLQSSPKPEDTEKNYTTETNRNTHSPSSSGQQKTGNKGEKYDEPLTVLPKRTVRVDVNNQDLLKLDLQTGHRVSDTTDTGEGRAEEDIHNLLLSTSA